MLFADEVRFEGLKHNNDLGERWGGGTQGQGKDMSTMSLIVGPMLSIKVN